METEDERIKNNESLVNSIDVLVQDYNKAYESLRYVYGSNGKMPAGIGSDKKQEYDEIVIDGGGLLDEDTITAIVMGACMNKKRLSSMMSTSTMGGDIAESNQMHICNNVVKGDEREAAFGPVILEGRKEAKEAIDAYRNGDDTKIKEMLSTFLTYCVAEGGNIKAAGSDNSIEGHKYESDRATIMLGLKILEENKFDVRPALEKGRTEINYMEFVGRAKALDAMGEGETQRKKVIDNFENMNTQEKEEVILSALFNEYLANEPRLVEKKRNNASLNFETEVFKNQGIDDWMDYGEQYEAIHGDIVITELRDTYDAADKNYIANNVFVHLSEKNGKKQLFALYKDAIRNSENFKKLVNSKTKEELIANFRQSDKVVTNGLSSIEAVELPNKAAQYNEEYADKLLEVRNNIKTKMIDASYLVKGGFADRVKKYGLEDFTSEGLNKNADMLDGFYQTMRKNTSIFRGSSENYRQLESKLKELRDLSRRYANLGTIVGATEINKYRRLTTEVERLAEHYLVNKTNINSNYARTRVEAVKNLRNAMTANRVSIDYAGLRTNANAVRRVAGDTFDTFNYLKPTKNENSPFYGRRYADPKTRSRLSPPYNLTRSAGVSVSIFALAATGKYTLEDLMDPMKHTKEKEAMFEKVVNAMVNSNIPSNNQWLAEQMYNGRIQVEKIVNKNFKEIDYSDPNILQNKKFCMLAHLGFAEFDAWQEMKNCKKEIVALAKKDHPEIQNYQQYKDFWTERQSPFSGVNESINKLHESVAEIAKGTEYTRREYGGALSAKVNLERSLSHLERAAKNPEVDNLAKWYNENKLGQENFLLSSMGDVYTTKAVAHLDNNKDLALSSLKPLLDGKLTKNAVMAKDGSGIKGLPTEQEMIDASIDARMEKKDAPEKNTKAKNKEIDARIKAVKKAAKNNADMTDSVAALIAGKVVAGNKAQFDTCFRQVRQDSAFKRMIMNNTPQQLVGLATTKNQSGLMMEMAKQKKHIANSREFKKQVHKNVREIKNKQINKNKEQQIKRSNSF